MPEGDIQRYDAQCGTVAGVCKKLKVMGESPHTSVPGRGDSRVGRLSGLALFVLALAVSVVLGRNQYRFAMSSPTHLDYETYFLPAAKAIAAGNSPYSVAGYVYSPVYALLIVPVSGKSWAFPVLLTTTIIAGIASCGVSAFALSRNRPLWHTGVIALLSVTTLLWNWDSSLILRLLNPEFLVLLCLVGAAYSRGVLSGFVLGLTGALKTWPAALVAWIAVSDRPRRSRLLGFAVAGGMTALSALGVGGRSGVNDMIRSATQAGDQPQALVFSVPGAAHALFQENFRISPIVISPLLHALFLGLGLAVLLILLGLCLWRPGPGEISLFNLTFLLLLVMPVSHELYLVLVLPALWFWAARLLAKPQRLQAVVTMVLISWWLITQWSQILWQFGTPPDPYGRYLWVFLPTVVAATASVLGAAYIDRSRIQP